MFKNLNLRTKLLAVFSFLAFLTILAGIGAIYNANNIGNSGIMVGEELAPLGDAAMEIKLTAANAHLIFEEITAGDTAEDIEVVWDLLDETLFYCDAILSGGSNDEGEFLASKDPVIIEKVTELRQLVVAFIASAHTRYDTRMGAAGIGSEADQAFDETYESLITDLSSIIEEQGNHREVLEITRLAGEAKFILADNHLFFEELLGGDTSITYQDIQSGFSEAKDSIQSIGGLIGNAQISQLKTDMDAFISAAEERNLNIIDVSESAMAVDAAFDDQYDTVACQT